MTTPFHHIETDLAVYIAGALERDVPPAVLDRARCHLLDTLAAIVSGRFLPAGTFGYRFAEAAGASGKATLIGSATTASPEYAAFANAMAAHADETDDSHVFGRFHPGCAIIPAAIAVSEQTGSDADAVLKAIALGYDVGARATMALGYTNPKTTVFSTHSLGALFGASATAGALLGLTAKEAEALLSFTVQQASGLAYWIRDPDHVEKSFDFGAKAARNGVFAAQLAKAGMTAPPQPLTGERGYLEAFAETPQPEELTAELGTRYEITRASIKKWSVGSPIQSVLDAVEALFGGAPVDPDSIAAIEVQLPSNRIHVIDDRHMPAVCCQYLVAVALLDGRVTFASSHDEARMQASEVLALRQKIRLIADDALTEARPERQSIVSVRLTDGSNKRHHAKVVRGTADDPMSSSEVAAKAQDILVPILGARAQEILSLVLERSFDMREILDACRVSNPQRGAAE